MYRYHASLNHHIISPKETNKETTKLPAIWVHKQILKVPQPLAEALLADMDFPDEARKQHMFFLSQKFSKVLRLKIGMNMFILSRLLVVVVVAGGGGGG